MDLSVWDDRKVADMEWEKYLKQRNRPYKPFEDLEANEKNLSDDHEMLIRFLYEAAERNENEKKKKKKNGIPPFYVEDWWVLSVFWKSPKLLIFAKVNDALATQDIIHKGNKMSDGNNAIYGKEGTQRKNKGARTSPISFDGQGSNASPEQKRMPWNDLGLEFQNKASRKRAITVTSEFPDQTVKQSASGIEIDKTVKQSASRSNCQAIYLWPPLWEATKNKNFGYLADGEAALPPSKRPHRTEESVVQKSKSLSNSVYGNLAPPVEQNETVDEVNTCSQPSGTSSSPSQKAVEIAYSKYSVICGVEILFEATKCHDLMSEYELMVIHDRFRAAHGQEGYCFRYEMEKEKERQKKKEMERKRFMSEYELILRDRFRASRGHSFRYEIEKEKEKEKKKEMERKEKNKQLLKE
ncbi:hypothetical protein Tco_0038062, partial [Tanacetum coccineum]